MPTYGEPQIRAGDQIEADWWPESVEASDATQISNITSATFIVGSPELGVTFVAPRSGRVGVCLSAGMFEQSAGDRLFLSFAVHEGTSTAGTQVRSPRTAFGISTSGDPTAGGSGEMVHGNMSMVENLTPRSTYYAVTMIAVDAGTTNDIRQRRITVIPLP